MKIKHWAGYGSITANSIFRKYNSFSKEYEIIIQVQGNHEQGLVRKDEYDILNWLLKRFDKEATNIISYIAFNLPDININGEMVERAEYQINYER